MIIGIIMLSLLIILSVQIGILLMIIRVYKDMPIEEHFITGLQTKPYEPVEWTTNTSDPVSKVKGKKKRNKQIKKDTMQQKSKKR